MKYLCKGNSIISKTDSRSTPRGASDQDPYYFMDIVEGIKNPKIILDENGDRSIIEDPEMAVADQLKDLYDNMVSDIYDELENKFGTRNDAAVQADSSTYEAMIKRPLSYVGALGFIDELSVITFAESKLSILDQYALFRIQRLETFRQERENIINA